MLSSLSGEIGLPFRTAYCSSKFAVTGFFEALRTEFKSSEVAITMICPPSVLFYNYHMRFDLKSLRRSLSLSLFEKELTIAIL